MKSYFKMMALICLFSAAFGNVSVAQSQNNPGKDTIITVKVSGITCSGDLPIIAKRVKQEKGIINCNAASKAAATTAFQVKYNPVEITYGQIVNAIQDAPSCDYPDERPFRVRKKK